ncbi:hypothetical protein [Clostridium vincentii]|uniref:Uncharacterized protein n=1 Tax=Clostridium vincentii TaxID=52704 RepID=A0A2T0BA37_9CLOT|nr:hypothetical protein [Clostridium vincentii]PRR80715.1 hypothetical protein CLVI_30060 [Clostridium vincentii]
MSILYGATCIVGIIFMLTFMFIGIWLFITALKAFQQLRYKNYILEKIYQKLDILAKASSITPCQKEEPVKDYENVFDLNNEDKLSKISQVKEFDSLNNIK